MSHLSAFQSHSFNYTYYEKWKQSTLTTFTSVYLIIISDVLEDMGSFLPTKETKTLKCAYIHQELNTPRSFPHHLVYFHKDMIIQNTSWPTGQNENLTQAGFYRL